MRTLRAVPAYGLVICGGALLCYGSASALHTITWLVQERHIPFATAVFHAGLIAILSGLVGNVAGGWFADACHRRWPAGRIWSLIIITMVSTPFALAFFALSLEGALFHLCWFVTYAAGTAYFGPLFAILQQVSPTRIRATAVACGVLGLNLLGVGAGPWVTGLIGDASSLTRGLTLSVIIALLSIVPFLLAARRYERDLLRARVL